ncbi:hypothetical protein [Mariniflexile sp.]|uniref:hypothetical protein n=1 Tax=Mariniflexile sp. TaxID=1979402 RepID=UPI003567CCD9
MKTLKRSVILCFVAIMLSSCMSLYDHYTYTNTIEAKVEALSLMDNSHEEYALYKLKADDLRNKMQSMVLYEKGKAKNEITVKMWEVMGNENKLMGSYLKLWENKGTLNPAFIEEAKPQIEEAFNILIQFEEKKDKKSENVLATFINNL